MSFVGLGETLQEHFEPTRVIIVERFHNHRRSQATSEIWSEKLSTHCEFGKYLNKALRDRLVCGLRSEAIQHCLLSETDLKFSRVFEFARCMEAAERNIEQRIMKGADCVIQYVA